MRQVKGVIALSLDSKEKRTGILIFFILLSCYGYFFPRWASWNQNSRLDLVMAFVDDGAVAIDRYYQNTGDYAVYEGHYYSTKAPGSSLFGVPGYWIFSKVTSSQSVTDIVHRISDNRAVVGTLREGGSGLLPEKLFFALALYVVTFTAVSIPAAMLGVVLYRFTGHYSSQVLNRLWVTLIYGLATIALPYSGSYFGHQIVAALLFVTFYLLFVSQRRSPLRSSQIFIAGLLLGLAVITEYPTILIAAALFCYAIYRLPQKRSILWLILGGLGPVLIWMAYNYQIYQRPIGFGYLYAPLYADKNNVGFFSLVFPHLEALWGITFSSYRGLFFLSPVLLLTVPGFFLFGASRNNRPEFLVCVWATISFLLFNGSSVMWQGGYAIGPRYILPMLPFMVLSLIFAFERWARLRWAKVGIGFLTLWSLLFVWAETIGGQSFPDWTPNPLFNYSLPKLIEGDIARNLGTVLGLSGWTSLLPLIFLQIILFSLLIQTNINRSSKLSTG